MNQTPFDELKEYHSAELKAVEQELLKMVQNPVSIIQALGEHIFNAGGKKLRPLLVLACSKLFQNPIPKKSIFLSAAVECIHTATLVHDDVIDDSELRRGHPTAKALWGNVYSILVGDFLFSKAFEFMVNSENLMVLNMLSKASSKICQGEVKQMVITKEVILNKDDYLDVIDLKTGSLFESACKAGSMIVDADELYNDALGKYGLNLGRAFQIIDDILDYASIEEYTGKQPGNDYQEGKITLPIIELLKKDSSFMDVFLDPEKNKLNVLKDAMIKNDIFNICYKEAENFAKTAIDALSIFPSSPLLSILMKLPLSLQKRTS